MNHDTYRTIITVTWAVVLNGKAQWTDIERAKGAGIDMTNAFVAVTGEIKEAFKPYVTRGDMTASTFLALIYHATC